MPDFSLSSVYRPFVGLTFHRHVQVIEPLQFALFRTAKWTYHLVLN